MKDGIGFGTLSSAAACHGFVCTVITRMIWRVPADIVYLARNNRPQVWQKGRSIDVYHDRMHSVQDQAVKRDECGCIDNMASIIPTLGSVVESGGGKSLVAAVKAVSVDGEAANIQSEVQNVRMHTRSALLKRPGVSLSHEVSMISSSTLSSECSGTHDMIE
jgi:hypothetical protein